MCMLVLLDLGKGIEHSCLDSETVNHLKIYFSNT